MRLFIESDLQACKLLLQFCCCYKVAFTKDRFVLDTNYYISV